MPNRSGNITEECGLEYHFSVLFFSTLHALVIAYFRYTSVGAQLITLLSCYFLDHFVNYSHYKELCKIKIIELHLVITFFYINFMQITDYIALI
jgi:hypothetical protein